MDFNLIKETTEYHSVFRVIRRNKKITEDFQMHYIELNKLKVHLENENLSTLEEWIIFIRDDVKDRNRKLVNDVMNIRKILMYWNQLYFIRISYRFEVLLILVLFCELS